MNATFAVVASAAVLVAMPAFAGVTVETQRIEKSTTGVGVDVSYPKTGVGAVDGVISGWSTGMVADFLVEAAESWKEMQSDDTGDMPDWTFTLDMGFETARNDDAMLVFDFDQSVFLGGAHPSHDITTYNFMMPEGWQVFLPEIFEPKALKTISDLAIADITREQGGPDGMSDPDWIRTGAGPKWSNFQDFLLLADKLVIRFPPYQVAAYAAGPQQVEIPLSKLSGLMRTDWKVPVASFDCGKAGTATEKAICADIPLARLDRDVSDAYAQALSWASDDADKAKVKDAQRAWIGTRDACGGDVACLTAQYEARLKVLSAPPA